MRIFILYSLCVYSGRYKSRNGSEDHLINDYNKPPSLPPRAEMPMEENIAYGHSKKMDNTDKSDAQKKISLATFEEKIQEQDIKMNADLEDDEYVNDDDFPGNISRKTQQHTNVHDDDEHLGVAQIATSANETTQDEEGNIPIQEEKENDQKQEKVAVINEETIPETEAV